jgi:hypothetical protein
MPGPMIYILIKKYTMSLGQRQMDHNMRSHVQKEDKCHRGGVAAWRFVYGFFSNGVPFDSPNRSEPCTSS